jgi:hypothetical protein
MGNLLPRCGAVVILRDGCGIEAWGLGDEARCLLCGTACAGLFVAGLGPARSRPTPIVLAF